MSVPTKVSYFAELKEWSERKLNLLDKYLDSATKIMASIGGTKRLTKVYYIDGFAGTGIYEDGSQGSPVRAANLAKQNQDAGKSYTLKCINVEEDSKNFANLQESTKYFGNLVLNLPGTFTANVDHILKEIRNVPSICFLDPFGVEGLDWDAVVKMIRRSGQTDFWIRFDAEYVLRLDGFYESTAPEATSKLGIITRTYGIDNIDQIHNYLLGVSPDARKRNAVELYLDQLQTAFASTKREGYAAVYQLKGLDGDNKYHLVFASSNKKGIVLASNIVYGIEETYQREALEYEENKRSQPSMFNVLGFGPSAEEIFASKVRDLKDEVWKEYQGKREVRRDIHAYLITKSHWFGKMKHPHMTQVFRELKDDGKIISVDGTFGGEDSVFTFQG
jgi:three-Cys-motif partner protein